MAKAARKGMNGNFEANGPSDGTGEGLGIGEGKGEGEEEHPLSEGKLEARSAPTDRRELTSTDIDKTAGLICVRVGLGPYRGYHSFMCLGRPFNVEKRWKLVRGTFRAHNPHPPRSPRAHAISTRPPPSQNSAKERTDWSYLHRMRSQERRSRSR